MGNGLLSGWWPHATTLDISLLVVGVLGAAYVGFSVILTAVKHYDDRRPD